MKSGNRICWPSFFLLAVCLILGAPVALRAAPGDLVSETFERSASQADIASVYPAWRFIPAGGNSTVSVTGGQLRLGGDSSTSTGFQFMTASTDEFTLDVDLGAFPGDYCYNVGIQIGVNNIVFHPGYPGTALRVEGTGGFSNTDIGFTLAAEILHPFRLSGDGLGNFTITLTDALNVDNTFSKSFSNPSSLGGFLSITRAGCPGLYGEVVADNFHLTTPAALAAEAGGPYYGAPGYTVTLDGRGSSQEDPAKWITAWDWDLDGDGQFDDASGPMVPFLCGAEGVTTIVALQVTDSAGQTDMDTALVTSFGDPAAPTITVDPSLVFYGDAVAFNGSTAANIVSYSWNSNIDGPLSTQKDFSTNVLSLMGSQTTTHTIQYCVSDNLVPPRTACAETVVIVHARHERTDLVLEWGDISFWVGGTEVTNPAPGNVVTVQATVHNLSDHATEAGTLTFTDTYDGIGLPASIAGAVLPAIAPRGEATVTATWNTAGLPEGYHLVEVNAPHDALETYFDNNSATHFIVLGNIPAQGNIALDLYNTSYTNPVQTGERFGVSGKLRYLWASSSQLPLTGGQVTLYLNGQQWQTLSVVGGSFAQEVVAPLTPGTYTLGIEATDATLTRRWNYSLTVNPLPGPDLAVTYIRLSNQVAEEATTVYATIANRGDFDYTLGTGEFVRNHLVVYGPSGEAIWAGDQDAAEPIPHGTSVTVAFEGWTPAQEGTYRFEVTTDVLDVVAEEYEGPDNVGNASYYLYPHHADLEVLQLSQQCGNISALVRNNGGLPASNWQLKFADGLGVWCETAPAASFAGIGTAQWVVCPSAYPFATRQNPATITVTALSDNDQVPENNELPGTFTFNNEVDFAVNDLWVNDQPYSGSNLVHLSNVTARVYNRLQAQVVNNRCLAASGQIEFLVDGVVKASQAVSLGAGQTSWITISGVEFLDTDFTAAANYTLTGRISVTTPDMVDALRSNDLRAEPMAVVPAMVNYQVTSAGIGFPFDPTTPHPRPRDAILTTAPICNVGLATGTNYQVAFYEEGVEQIGDVQTIATPLPPGLNNCVTISPQAGGSPVYWGTGRSGHHVILVPAAPNAGSQDDPDDANNQATRKVWVNFAPRAQGSVLDPKAAWRPNEAVSFSGAGSDDALDLDLLGQVKKYHWEFGDTTTAVTDAPQDTVTHQYAMPGTYIVKLTVEDNSSVLSEQVTLAGMVVVAQPDLTVSGVSGTPTALTTGQIINVSATVSNLAPSDSGVPCTVKFLLTVNGVVGDSDDVELGAVTVAALAGSGSTTASGSFAVPAGAAGTCAVAAVVDSAGVVTDSNEGNNTAVGTAVTVSQQLPDLIVSAVSPGTTTVTAGQTMTVSVTVKNQGQGAAAASLAGIYFSLNNSLSADDLFVASVPINALAAGASQARSNYTITVPAGVPAAKYFLIGGADYDVTIMESVETNNTRTATKTVTVSAPKPDLVIDAISNPPASARLGDTFPVTFTVRNAGQVPASAFVIGLYFSSDAAIATSDTWSVDSPSIASLAAGATEEVTVTVVVPAVRTGRSYYVGAYADRSLQVTEASETNNGKASTAKVAVAK